MSIKTIIPNAGAVVFRRSLHASPPSLRPNFKLGGDLLLWVSIMHGRKIASIAEPLNRYRFHATTARHMQSSVYMNESSAITQWILNHTQAWRSPGEILLLRQHRLDLWFSIGLEPASLLSWQKERDTYRFLHRLYGPKLIARLLQRLPISAWRLTLTMRMWWDLGWRSLRRKIGRRLPA